MDYIKLAELYAEKAEYDRSRGIKVPLMYYVSGALGALNAIHEQKMARLLVLATKHCPNKHHDFAEIQRIAGDEVA